ncbi:MAG: hypothetical protein WBI82_07295 [Sphaerochaeta sp.]
MPPFPPHGAGYITLLSSHSLGNETMVMPLLLSFRWGMRIQPEYVVLWSDCSAWLLFNEDVLCKLLNLHGKGRCMAETGN